MYQVKFFNESNIELSIPSLRFEYGVVFDWGSIPPIDKREIKKLEAEIETFSQVWKEKGERLLTNTIKLLGKQFSRNELAVSLVLTHKDEPMSNPLMISVLPYLAYLGVKNISERAFDPFVCEVYRSLLSLYVDEHFTDLDQIYSLEIFKGKSKEFKRNLILMAIMLSAYQITFPGSKVMELIFEPMRECEMKSAWKLLVVDTNSYQLILESLFATQTKSIVADKSFNEYLKENNVPQLFFQHAEDLDKENKDITAPIIGKLKTLIPVLTEVWNKNGTPLLIETVKLIHKKFPQNELTASVLLNPDRRPMSYPFVANVRRQLYLPGEVQRSREFFIFTTYMLLLFRYFHANFPKLDDCSRLIQRYADKEDEIKNRLFPVSIMYHTYAVTNRSAELHEVVKEINNPTLFSVIKIIESEGYESFIEELHNYESLSQRSSPTI
ncbi:hypothetical protein [Legionella brunensis]|uniref:Uncharacterized protein n=1 Tax=Legionella brunensis TaxID=29422 RepID=A0A0W0S361_9GAMM|nr:hypothetical protein [Legionella brunensis]KTC77848.1 hypothetical protein Lbru_2741 [Legionella brunensis]